MSWSSADIGQPDLTVQFAVLALDPARAERRLIIDAADATAARRAAARDGMTVLEVRPMRAGGLPLDARGADASRFDLDLFCQELLAMLEAGVAVPEALQTLAAKGHGRGSVAIAALVRSIGEGLPLSGAMAAQRTVFPLLLVESMRAAERTSDYVPALRRFVDYRRLARELRAKLMTAALYPMILLAVSAAVLLFLVGYVVPRFAQVYDDLGDRIPLASRWLLMAGTALAAQPLFSAFVVLLLGVAGALAWRAGYGRAALVLLVRTVPRVRELLSTAEMARLYRTLALLLSGGMPMVASLELAAGVLPPSTAQRLQAARRGIAEGRSFSVSVAEQGLSTPVAERFFRVGEATGRLAEMIDRAADFHEDEVGRAADWVGRVIGPVMMLVMGVVIGFVVVLMYMPIFALTEVLQ